MLLYPNNLYKSFLIIALLLLVLLLVVFLNAIFDSEIHLPPSSQNSEDIIDPFKSLLVRSFPLKADGGQKINLVNVNEQFQLSSDLVKKLEVSLGNQSKWHAKRFFENPILGKPPQVNALSTLYITSGIDSLVFGVYIDNVVPISGPSSISDLNSFIHSCHQDRLPLSDFKSVITSLYRGFYFRPILDYKSYLRDQFGFNISYYWISKFESDNKEIVSKDILEDDFDVCSPPSLGYRCGVEHWKLYTKEDGLGQRSVIKITFTKAYPDFYFKLSVPYSN